MTGFTTPSPTVARRCAVVAALAFLGAGALTVGASWARWGEACVPDLDSEACGVVQAERFDYLVPSEPWEPIGHSAVLAGAAFVLLAVGLVLLFAVLRSALWARAVQALFVGSVLGIGLLVLLAARSGQPLGFEWVAAPWLLSPLLLAPILLEAVVQDRAVAVMSERAWCAWAGALLLANPFFEFIVMPILVGHQSYDTTPWDGLLTGSAFALAGLVVLGGLSRAVARRRVPAQR